MTDKDTEFLKRLLVTFKVEAQEHLRGISSGLLELEKDEAPERRTELIETIFRDAHSLKGAARAVNLAEIEALCQALEGVFSALKKSTLPMSSGLFDLLQEALDFLGIALSRAEAERSHEDRARQRQLVNRLEMAVKSGVTETGKIESGEAEKRGNGENVVCVSGSPIPRLTDSESRLADSEAPIQAVSPLPSLSGPSAQKVSGMSETVRVSKARLTSLLLQSEEMLSTKLASSQRVLDMRSTSVAFGAWKKEWDRIRPLALKLRQTISRNEEGATGEQQRSLVKLLDFLEWNSDFIASIKAGFTSEVRSAERNSRSLGCKVNNLLDEMKKVLMFPFSSLLEVLPKVVRDLSRESCKEIDLSITGEEIEVDRRILEEMKDPLLHMVRNCIDHGIESPADRTAKGKPRRGKIRIAVSPRDDKVELVVSDDGGGIPLESVRSALLKLGIRSGETVGQLDDRELASYVFQSGVSTSPIITEISGRGLGLAIVREKVEKLGGTVGVETLADEGTTFRVVLPLTVATFRGILVRAGDRLFVLPAMHVTRVLRVKPDDIRTVEGRETVSLNGETVSLACLAAVLELPLARNGAKPPELLPVTLLSAGDTRIAFQVDQVLGENEVLLKGLGRQLSRVRNVAGATILGDGRVAPILNIPDLLKSAVRLAASAPCASGNKPGETTERKHSVLVVEDSITTRTLLKNILESAGYEVATAVDGLDAFSKLRIASFDMVISDVDMPRMNGFELTAKIRADKSLGELPVVLVTALASREDRERGIDAGANAYIVKSSFDQSNLLDVMKKLI